MQYKNVFLVEVCPDESLSCRAIFLKILHGVNMRFALCTELFVRSVEKNYLTDTIQDLTSHFFFILGIGLSQRSVLF